MRFPDQSFTLWTYTECQESQFEGKYRISALPVNDSQKATKKGVVRASKEFEEPLCLEGLRGYPRLTKLLGQESKTLKNIGSKGLIKFPQTTPKTKNPTE